MVCCNYFKTVILHAGNIHKVTEPLVHFANFRSLKTISAVTVSSDRIFPSIRKMMVDTSATANRGLTTNNSPEKDDDGGYASGGFKSEDGKLSCGYSSFRGKRASMEDFYDVKTCKINGQTVCLFGIFDGDVYQKTDSDFLETGKDTFRDDGSTASTAVLVGNHLYVANVGDSRTVISKAGKAIPLSEDHKPNRSDERKRIENAGGVVMWAGTWRVGGVLAMSRAFGNRMLKQYVVAEPEIQEQELDEEFELLVLASDGLWDVVPNEDAISLALSEKEPESAARKLIETAFSRGSADNITCIVVRLNHESATESEPEAQTEPEPEAQTESEPEMQNETETEIEPESNTEIQIKTETKTE